MLISFSLRYLPSLHIPRYATPTQFHRHDERRKRNRNSTLCKTLSATEVAAPNSKLSQSFGVFEQIEFFVEPSFEFFVNGVRNHDAFGDVPLCIFDDRHFRGVGDDGGLFTTSFTEIHFIVLQKGMQMALVSPAPFIFLLYLYSHFLVILCTCSDPEIQRRQSSARLLRRWVV